MRLNYPQNSLWRREGGECCREKCTQGTLRRQGPFHKLATITQCWAAGPACPLHPVPARLGLPQQHPTLRATNTSQHQATHSQTEPKLRSVLKARAGERLCSSQVRNRSTQMDHECKHWLTRALQIGPLKARQRWMEMSEQEHKAAQFLPLSRSGSITVLVIELLAVMLLLRLKKTWHSKSLFPCKTVRFGAWSFLQR